MPAEPDSTNGVEMKRALSQVATGLFQICYIFNEVYTYDCRSCNGRHHQYVFTNIVLIVF